MGPERSRLNRRAFLQAAAGALPVVACADGEMLPPVRAITHGPKFHWFGYYDKLEFDPTGRYVLGMEVGFENRSPNPEDVIKVGMVDLKDRDRWIELGESRAWNWQQGCMLQWLPGSKTEIIWNDRQNDRFVCHILDVKTRKKRLLPAPISAISPNAQWAVAPDFRRLGDTRPGYGYAGVPDPNKDVPAPPDAGIWWLDLKSGRQRMVVSFADAAKVPYMHGDLTGAKHWFNHLLVSPDGSRFIFLHGWSGAKGPRRSGARMFAANPEGKELYVVEPYGSTLKTAWRDPKHILAWAWHPSHGEKYYLYEDRTDKVEVFAPEAMPENGHPSYLPGNRWILNDTYPDKERYQHPYLYNVESGKRFPLGHFRSPPEYRGEWRCDTHPRSSPDGRTVVIDSPHGGNGRQLYLIDSRRLVA